MVSFRMIVIYALCAALLPSPGAAQDLSKYRDFEFGMSIESLAQRAGMNPSAARTIHQRPEMIQTLNWELYGFFGTSLNRDSIRSIRFDFYNGELSKLVVTYDTVQTEGLTTGDMIEAISALYGPATAPEAIVIISTPAANEESSKVLARWENAQYSYDLFRSPFGASFGIVAFSKRLDLIATAANLEAKRLDKLEAPARESERQKKELTDQQTAQEKARLISKPKFRP